jgi:ParB-like chromosome segregation protein Spo0J
MTGKVKRPQIASDTAIHRQPIASLAPMGVIEAEDSVVHHTTVRRAAAVERSDHHRSPQPASNGAARASGARGQTADISALAVAVPVLSLRPADSPRLNGEDKAHIARLAEIEAPLPPILVDRRSMRVIDGMHRLIAASLQGRETIDVKFFDGSEADVFLRAVQENVTHGLPLSQADRRAAAERIIASHPHLSDRAIGQAAGLAAKTVAAIRKRSTDGVPQSNARVGRDGKVRPLDSAQRRRRAAELLTQQPGASLRDVARAAGISPATVLDVRKRLERGDPPAPEKPDVARNGVTSGDDEPGQSAGPGFRAASVPGALLDPAVTVEKLLRDPSLRLNEQGKDMLRLLHVNALGAEQLPFVARAVPPHCLAIIVQLARQYARMWQDFARELDGRARIIDPSAAARRSAGRMVAAPAPGCRSLLRYADGRRIQGDPSGFEGAP